MPPTFYKNNFKPWAPLPRKPPRSCFSVAPNLPYSRPCHHPLPGTLPPPKHDLPARPPPEVCVLITTTARPGTPSSQIQTREIPVPESEPDTFSEKSEDGAASPRDLAPDIPAPDPIHRYVPQDDTSIPTDSAPFGGDYAEGGPSSPSISGLDNYLEEFLRLPDDNLEDARDDIPIDPMILADHGVWEEIDVPVSVPRAESLANPETTCLYPDPPAILHSPPDRHRPPSEGDVTESGGDTDLDASCPSDAAYGNHHIGGEPESSQRKTQQSERRICSRFRVRSPSPSSKDSFTTLRSLFDSLPPPDRLQFLSWLFEGTLSRCFSDSSLTAYEGGGEARTSRRSSPESEIGQSPRVCRKARGSSRKGLPWSKEEADLLLRLKSDETRSWSQVAKLFVEQYPGRSQGSIQVFWSTKMRDFA